MLATAIARLTEVARDDEKDVRVLYRKAYELADRCVIHFDLKEATAMSYASRARIGISSWLKLQGKEEQIPDEGGRRKRNFQRANRVGTIRAKDPEKAQRGINEILEILMGHPELQPYLLPAIAKASAQLFRPDEEG